VAAPGVDISGYDGDGRITTRSGTNSASALVSAIAAQLKGALPTATPAELKRRLILGTDDNPALYGKVTAKGRLNAIKALDVKIRQE
jgi:subtilisin family serine protease